MKDLFGKDIGTTIKFDGEPYEATKPWPEETHVSAGYGVVFSRRGDSYTTLFMEAYPPGASFIRGEGKTREECEQRAWDSYQRALHCKDGKEHEWEARNYVNGAGFCKHCNTFKSHAFTPEELNAYCASCGTATFYSFEKNDAGEHEFLCENCYPHDSHMSLQEFFEDVFAAELAKKKDLHEE